MKSAEEPSCCFRECAGEGAATLRVEVTPPPDGDPVLAWAHESCFESARHPSVEADDPEDHGRIPSAARCAFCGEALPWVGRHPHVFDVGTFIPPHRLWAHADCMLEHVVPGLADELKAARQAPC